MRDAKRHQVLAFGISNVPKSQVLHADVQTLAVDSHQSPHLHD